MSPTRVPMRFADVPLLWTVEGVYSAEECARAVAGIERSAPALAEQVEAVVEPRPGRVAIFQHKIRHEGCEVVRGTKYAMRTDAVYEAPTPIELGLGGA